MTAPLLFSVYRDWPLLLQEKGGFLGLMRRARSTAAWRLHLRPSLYDPRLAALTRLDILDQIFFVKFEHFSERSYDRSYDSESFLI